MHRKFARSSDESVSAHVYDVANLDIFLYDLKPIRIKSFVAKVNLKIAVLVLDVGKYRLARVPDELNAPGKTYQLTFGALFFGVDYMFKFESKFSYIHIATQKMRIRIYADIS